MTNILKAIVNFSNNPTGTLETLYKNKIRIQKSGDPLEYFVKDIFSNTITEPDLLKKEAEYQKYFSYFGNANNPPDCIIKNSDAIEIKKIESDKSSIALNGNYILD